MAKCQRVVAAAVVLSQVACTSLQPIPGFGAPGSSAMNQGTPSSPQVASGALVRVQLRSGETMDVVVAAVDSIALIGTRGGRDVRIEWQDVAALESRRFDWVRTGLLVLGIVALGQLAHGLAKVVNPAPP
jgi:hypothetical protein